MALPKGRVHALHRGRMHQGLPERCAVSYRLRHGRPEPQCVHRMQGLRLSMPFDIPRYNQATDKIYKCDLCYTRLHEGQKPACVLSCPTGAITIGEKKAMIEAAYNRVAKLDGKATVYGDKFVGGTHVMYILSENPAAYDKLPSNPKVPASVILWKTFSSPLPSSAWERWPEWRRFTT